MAGYKVAAFAVTPPRPTAILSKDETMRPTFTNDVLAFPTNSMSLDRFIQSERDLAGVIRLVTRIFRVLCRFRDEYVGDGRGVPNVFAEGFGLLVEDLEPAIPATALGPRLLVTDGATLLSKPNDLASAWALLLEKVHSSNCNLLPYKHYAQVTAANITLLLPQGIDSDEQVAFLETFCETLSTHTNPSPFEVDQAKLEAAARFAARSIAQVSNSSEKRVPIIFGKTIEIYMAISGERSEFAKRMSFAPIQGASDKSLGGLLRAILESLGWTKQHSVVGDPGIGLLNSIESEFLMLAQTVCSPVDSKDRLSQMDATTILDGAMRVTVGQGDDYELIIDDAVLISSSGEVVADAPITVCRFGGYSQFEEPLRPQHSAELRRSLVYSLKAQDKTVLFLTDDIVRLVFEVIRKRSDAFFGAGRSALDAAMVECLEDRSRISQPLKGYPCFERACNVLRCNHFTSEMIQGAHDCERVLLRWLEQFEPTEAAVLLEVIAAHQCVTAGDVKAFIDNVAEHKVGSIVFSTKKLADQGGVHRLFTLTQEGQELIRSLALDAAVSKISSFKGGDEALIVLAETILTGGQLEQNFKWHYLAATETNDPYMQKQRLFEIAGSKTEFVRGLKCFRRILILAAAYTQRGANRLRSYLSHTLEIPMVNIEVKGEILKDSACFFGEAEDISAASKSAFKSMVSDMERIRALFSVSDEGAYSQSLGELDRANLIVRPNSVTKKGLKIFTLAPRNMNIPPLFRETKEHE